MTFLQQQNLNRNVSSSSYPCQVLQTAAIPEKSTSSKGMTWLGKRISLLHSFNHKVERVKSRLDRCPDMGCAFWVCKECSELASTKPYRLNCGLRYCKDKNCIDKRIKKNKLRLNNYKIYSKRLIHFEMGFAYVPFLDKIFKKSYEIILKQFYKEMKKLGTPINALRSFDIAEKEGEYYLHFHHAQMPVDNYVQFVKNCRIAKERTQEIYPLHFTFHPFGWRYKRGLFKYFAKRMAGVYGDEKKKNVFYLADIISLKQYVANLYGLKCLAIIGSLPERSESKDINLVPDKPEFCPYCHSKHLRLIPQANVKPPPERYCHECGQIYKKEEFNGKLRMCEFCLKKKSPEAKMSRLQNKFKEFIDNGN